jgi:hypothetical protein
LHKQTINQRWCIIFNSLKNETEDIDLDLELINDDLANTETELFLRTLRKNEAFNATYKYLASKTSIHFFAQCANTCLT